MSRSNVTEVKKLRVLAAEANFKSIISKFGGIFQKEKRHNFIEAALENLTLSSPSPQSEDDYCLTKDKRDKALKDLKENLDGFLIGPFSKERHRLVHCFSNSPIPSSAGPFNPDLFFAFFTCLLDDSFTSFNLTAEKEENCPFKSLDPLELLEIITTPQTSKETTGS